MEGVNFWYCWIFTELKLPHLVQTCLGQPSFGRRGRALKVRNVCGQSMKFWTKFTQKDLGSSSENSTLSKLTLPVGFFPRKMNRRPNERRASAKFPGSLANLGSNSWKRAKFGRSKLCTVKWRHLLDRLR